MKNVIIAVGLLVFALGLALMTVWHIENWRKDVGKDSFFQLKEVEVIPFEKLQEEAGKTYSLPSKNGYQEFISEDDKFKIQYPADWLIIEEQAVLEGMVFIEWAEKYNLKTLFLAQNLRGEKFAQITVHRGKFNLGIKEIIEEIKKASQEQKWQARLKEISIEEKEGIFEGEYQTPANIVFRSREKVLLNEGGEAYLVSFVALSQNWEEFSPEANFIIDSAQLILTNQ